MAEVEGGDAQHQIGQTRIDKLISAHELWTQGLRNPRWRKYTLDGKD